VIAYRAILDVPRELVGYLLGRWPPNATPAAPTAVPGG
jgi:hypothetical protein